MSSKRVAEESVEQLAAEHSGHHKHHKSPKDKKGKKGKKHDADAARSRQSSTDGVDVSTKKSKKSLSSTTVPATISVVSDIASVPLLAMAPDVPQDAGLEFNWYVKRSSNDKKGDIPTQSIIATETPTVQYVGESAAVTNGNSGTNQPKNKYMIGIYDPEKGSMKLALAPAYTVTPTVKAFRNFELRYIDEKNTAARNILGETFGTRKRKLEIRALERNKVDVSGIRELAPAIKKDIDDKTKNVVSNDELRDELEANSLLSCINREATTVAEMYDINHIAPASEVRAVPVSEIMDLRVVSEVKELLNESLRPTSWVWSQISTCLISKTRDSHRIQYLIYLQYLINLFNAKQKDLRKFKELGGLLGGAPDSVVARFMRRFTERQTDEGYTNNRMTAKLKDTLLATILVLALLLNNYSLDAQQFADDLSISAKKIATVGREVGCRMSTSGDASKTLVMDKACIPKVRTK